MKTTNLNKFYTLLAKRPSSPTVFNPWSQTKKLDYLKSYIKQIVPHEDIFFCVGEAPGYKGCAITGLPFTSTHQIIHSPHSIFSNLKNKMKKEQLCKENTAKIFWDNIPIEGPFPLIWNAFPFHPHNKGDLSSNRKPNQKECNEGIVYLQMLVNHFHIQRVYAIGRVAEELLLKHYSKDDKVEVIYIRHPSHGGKQKFVEGIQKVFN